MQGVNDTMSHHLKDMTLRRQFALILCILFGLESILLVIFTSSRAQQAQEKTHQETLIAIENATSYLSNVLLTEQENASFVAGQKWFIKLSSSAAAYQDAIDPVRLKEICSEYFFYSTSDNLILSRGIYFPTHQKVISSKGSNSLPYYLESIGVPSEKIDLVIDRLPTYSDILTFPCTTSSFMHNEKILLVQPLSNTKSPRAYLFTLLNNTILDKQLSLLLSKNITGFEVVISDPDSTSAVLLSSLSSACSETDALIEGSSVSLTGWHIRFHVDHSILLQDTSYSAGTLAWFMLVIFATIAFAFLLSGQLYRPLHQVLVSLPDHVSSNNIVQDVLLSVKNVTDHLMQFQQESYMRALLDGSYNTTNPDALLRFSDDMWVQVLILQASHSRQVTETEVFSQVCSLFAQDGNLYHTLIFAANRTAVLTVASQNEENLQVAVSQALSLWNGRELRIYPGIMCKGYAGICPSYQNAQEQMHFFSMQRSGTAYHFPLDWENQLIAALCAGNSNVACTIIDKLMHTNIQQLQTGELTHQELYQLAILLSSLLHRASIQHNTSSDIRMLLESINYTMSPEEISLRLLDAAQMFCGEIAARLTKRKTDISPVLRYINEHYTEATISSVSVQDAFDISINTLNKQIKDETGLTFQPYLMQLRMELAKELLTRNLPLNDVVEQVGYTSEYSFRRAFSRYTGVKVQDYIALANKQQ